MIRRPTTEGPPACWGGYRDDADCATCNYAAGCRKAHAAAKAVSTVADACGDRAKSVADECTSRTLATYAHGLFVKAGGNQWPKWTSPGFLAAFDSVIAACAVTDFDARQYVRAQVEALTLNIERGWRMGANSFTGQKADERFKRWAARRKHRHGDATRDRTLYRDQEARKAAAFAYATARLQGAAPSAAREAAQEHVPGWILDDMVDELRVPALMAALSAIDPLLAHMVVIPDQWTWKQAVELGAHIKPVIAHVKTTENPVNIGEFL